ncbi:MAG: U32 family peptidase [Muricoprocola sp.]
MSVELLAPAGSYESMKAAYAAGADAVYIGGSRFGARAYADNPDTDELLDAIAYAHLRNKKIYLTVNTLMKQQELTDFVRYIEPYYEAGVDALIVQDMGAMKIIQECFPDIDIHASTQMTITGVRGASLLKKLGASRVVTARELSLQEIREIKNQVDIEMESFVHGALCFCYSGQCLFSSMIGGRSGNRGRCAQPCRLPYQLGEEKNQSYLMSPKDMCTLSLIPDLIENGVYSFKIEGRMKRPEYTAGVTKVYRKYIDLYEKEGRKNFYVKKEDLEILMDLYNRGGFSEGYYQTHNGPRMMSMQRPNHWGTEAGRILNTKKSGTCKALEELHAGDVLEYRSGKELKEYTLAGPVAKGKEFVFPGIAGNKKERQAIIYRTKNAALLSELKTEYIDRKNSVKIHGKFILSMEKPAILTVSTGQYSVTLQGESPVAALKKPLSAADIEKQLRKTGNTDFEFESIDIELEENLFLPLQVINDLRRNALDQLKKQMISSCMRKQKSREYDFEAKEQDEVFGEQKVFPYLTASIESLEQLQPLLEDESIRRIYISHSCFHDREEFIKCSGQVIEKCHSYEKECFYILPWIFRTHAERYYDQVVWRMAEAFDGMLIKNLEEFPFLQEKGYARPVMTDHNLYIWNTAAKDFWKEQHVTMDTVPQELNCREIRKRGCRGSEIIVYGYQPLMVSAQCFLKNTEGCSKEKKVCYLKDRKNKSFPVKNECSFCYNVVYNSSPLELAGAGQELISLAPDSVRLTFTIESKEQVRKILHVYDRLFTEGDRLKPVFSDFTRGHFKRGVE